jgi:hypothetical protein
MITADVKAGIYKQLDYNKHFQKETDKVELKSIPFFLAVF